MVELFTTLIIRNDSTANWLAHADTVLSKGEFAVEFTTDGKSKVKIGDGVTPWSGLSYLTDNVEIPDITNHAPGKDDFPAEGKEGILYVATEEKLIYVWNSQSNTYEPLGGDTTAIEDRIEALEQKASTVYTYKGSVQNYTDLPTEGMEVGDVYNIENASLANNINAGDNVAWNGTTWDNLRGIYDLSSYVTTDEFTPIKEIVEKIPEIYATKAQLQVSYQKIAYEVSHKPVGTLVDYFDKEIRIMCPANTNWQLQNSGENANPNAYYIGFKAYAPSDDVVSFKEDLAETINDNTMYYFENNDFAGIDSFGRKYSIVWLGVAIYDPELQTWSYYGEQSSKDRYIGYYYSVEWYNASGIIVGSDVIRINLSNEDCHNLVTPYYVRKTVQEVEVGGTLVDIVNNKLIIDIATSEQAGVVKSSEEENHVIVDVDGTMEINSVNITKLVQHDGDVLVLNGGAAEK